jgi:hypothetical protein
MRARFLAPPDPIAFCDAPADERCANRFIGQFFYRRVRWKNVWRLGARRCGQSLTRWLCNFLVYGIVPEEVEILVSAKVQKIGP